jgi:hypothetical protein
MPLKGKGFFTFMLSECEGGDPAAILAVAQATGLSHVLVKIADGVDSFGLAGDGRDLTAPVVKALRSTGIAVWGWHYIYGFDPIGEARIAVNRVHELELDGYAIDAEEEYKMPGRENAARKFMNELRIGLPGFPVALSSYRFPNYHPELPWAAFLEKCDYNMPQMYWEQSHDPGWQLQQSYKQCRTLPNARPYLVTGPAYGSGGWEPNAEEIAEFLSTARSLGIPAVNFFSWDYCRLKLPQVWDAVANAPWPARFVGKPVPGTKVPATGPAPVTSPGDQSGSAAPAPVTAPTDFSKLYLSALNSRQAAVIAALYAADAVYVRGNRTLRGVNAIQNDYEQFLSGLPTDVTFTMTGVDIAGDVRYLLWEVGDLIGRQTVILQEGKIAVDYTFLG